MDFIYYTNTILVPLTLILSLASMLVGVVRFFLKKSAATWFWGGFGAIIIMVIQWGLINLLIDYEYDFSNPEQDVPGVPIIE